MMATVYVLTDNEPYEGGTVFGAFSTLEKAKAAAATFKDDGFYFRQILAVELDADPQPHTDDAT